MDRKIKKKKLTLKRIVAILFAIGFLGFCFYRFVLGDNSPKLNVQKERLSIATVSAGPFQEFIAVVGTVIPKKTTYLDAVEGGRVEKRYVEAGSLVKEGQNIVTLANTATLPLTIKGMK